MPLFVSRRLYHVGVDCGAVESGTFWTGVGGWSEKQFADGTITWTAPSGRTYTTKPGGSLFFPQLATRTGELKFDKIAEPAPERGLMMPRRRRTRKQERDERIAAERADQRTTHPTPTMAVRRTRKTPTSPRSQQPTALMRVSGSVVRQTRYW